VAFNIVQSASATGVGSASVAFPNSNLANNSLIVIVGENTSPDTFTLSDSLGNTYISIAQIKANNSLGGSGIWQLFYCSLCLGGGNTVSVTAPAGGSVFLAIHEFPFVSPIDAQSSNTGSGNSQTSGNATTTSPAELLFAFTGGVGNAISALSAGSGWTQAQRSVGGTFCSLTEWQAVTSTGTFDATSTSTVGKSGSIGWAMELVTFVVGVNPPPSVLPPTPNTYDQISATTLAAFPGDRGEKSHGQLTVVSDMIRK
jgi:hypothetical protein